MSLCIEGKIEEFELGNLLGRGSFGSVYAACSKITGQAVAIKILNKDAIQKENCESRVTREIEIHYRLRHPGIVAMKTFFEDTKAVYMVLERCEGGTVKKYLQRKRRLDEPEAAVILKQVRLA